MSLTLSGVPSPAQQIESLQRELYARNREIADLTEQLRQERSKTAQSDSGIQNLREVLTPLHRALQMVFGEIEAMGVNEPVSSLRSSAAWDSWKSKLPSGEAKAIDALLLHGSMTVTQLRIHIGCATRTAYNIVGALKSKGLINRDREKVSLKEL